ncbi:hypothetical protein [Nocardiopsis metallicus]|uniref:Uncharacterized protein n=1 Tax=Nocardiopsis metallicus TaxID=179819 RepID=A0A840W257_9ACTN|nr:hypothetical protein [Nocardiopsis metallicus]MBB5490909.1 hypothetical protein [Nocardiopsis metallicus]
MNSGRRRIPAFNVVLLLIAALIVSMGAANVERSLRAARADGTPGTFSATMLDCVQHPGHESCTCYGTYAPESGGPERADIYLYGGNRQTCRVGEETAAVDVGSANRVYGPEGSNEWVMTAGLILFGLGLGGWTIRSWWVGRSGPVG